MAASTTRPQALTLHALMGRLAGCEPTLIGEGATMVSAITEDSRLVTSGTLFVARRGEASDGTRFVAAAQAGGATAVLCEAGTGVEAAPRIEVSDLRLAWGICAQELYGRPADSLKLLGITGTNGKTTVACIVEQALLYLGVRVGRLGTLGFFLDGVRVEGSLTTPQPDQFAKCLAQVRDAGGEAMVLEVSSHALDQQRTAGVQFTAVALTNLTQDHLDYHKTMDEYGRAKARLFREGTPQARVLNADDAFGRQLADEFPGAMTVSAAGAKATISAIAADFTREGLSAVVRTGEQTQELRSRLLGRHNLENLLVSCGILLALGYSLELACSALHAATGVPGRLERCDSEGDDITVVVDYAHTPDALSRALSTLAELQFAELVCLFGCGGDRDRSKRPKMGEAAAAQADIIYVTSDNPRREDPVAIINEVIPGLASARRAPVVEPDRRTAIEQAIARARPGAVVLIAGKGHEDYQIVGDEVLEFDDRVEARRALALRRERART